MQQKDNVLTSVHLYQYDIVEISFETPEDTFETTRVFSHEKYKLDLSKRLHLSSFNFVGV